jgi:hypothetical protein
MHDSLIVRRLDHLAEPLEQRDEALEGERPGPAQQLAQRDALDQLHSDPHQAVGLDAEP